MDSNLATALPLMLHETAQSFVGRLTGHYFCSTILEFCRDFGLRRGPIMRGDLHEVRKLAHVTKVDEVALVAWTPQAVGRGMFSLRGERYLSRWAGGSDTAYECPVCARIQIERYAHLPPDNAVYGRAEFQTGFFTACPIHDVLLIQRKAAVRCGVPRRDITYTRSIVLDEVLGAEPEKTRSSPLERYAFNRLAGAHQASSDLLDKLETLTDIVRMSHLLGKDIALQQSKETLSDRELKDLGFVALRDGSAGLKKLFEQARSAGRAGTRMSMLWPKITSNLGNAQWSKHWQIRTAMANVAFEVMPFAAGETIFGVQCTQRRFYTFYKATKGLSVHPRVLDALIKVFPEMTVRSTANRADAIIDADVTSRILKDQGTIIDGHTAEKLVGQGCYGTAGLMGRRIVELGLAQPIGDPNVAGGYYFSQRELMKKIEAAKANFKSVAESPAGYVNLVAARLAVGTSTVWLTRQLLAGAFRTAVHVKGKAFLAGLRFERAELFSVVTGIADAIPLREVAQQLQVSRHAVTGLVDARYLVSKNAPPNAPASWGTLLSQSEVNDFKRQYMSWGEIKDQVKMQPKGLKAKGLLPAIEIKCGAHTTTFYRRGARLPI